MDWKNTRKVIADLPKFGRLRLGLRSGRFAGTTLIAGPYIGEFGWELTEWQGYVRALRPHFRRTVAISYRSSAFLYEGCDFWPHDRRLQDSGYGFGQYSATAIGDITAACIRAMDLRDVFCLTAFDLNAVTRSLIGPQRHVAFFVEPEDDRFDVVFHFRHFRRGDGDSKNTPTDHADALAAALSGSGRKLACIGHPDLAYCPAVCADRRNADLRETVRTISGASLVVGGSSAPMHLASLCDKPIVTWIGPPADGDRFFGHWNPHRSPVHLVTDQSFQPDWQVVLSTVERALDKAAAPSLDTNSMRALSA